MVGPSRPLNHPLVSGFTLPASALDCGVSGLSTAFSMTMSSAQADEFGGGDTPQLGISRSRGEQVGGVPNVPVHSVIRDPQVVFVRLRKARSAGDPQ